jgi:hypothetical protein
MMSFFLSPCHACAITDQSGDDPDPDIFNRVARAFILAGVDELPCSSRMTTSSLRGRRRYLRRHCWIWRRRAATTRFYAICVILLAAGSHDVLIHLLLDFALDIAYRPK